MLTDVVSYKVAKALAKHNLYYYEDPDNFYIDSEGTLGYSDSLQVEKVHKGDLINSCEIDYLYAQTVPAPTYAQVLDALSIVGMNLTLSYKNGFINFKIEKQNKVAEDKVITPDHFEDEALEQGILDACELLELYPNVFNTANE